MSSVKTFQKPWLALPEAGFSERRAVVIGAGLSGASIADSLARRGWQVLLIERHAQAACEASGIAAGIVLPRLAAAGSNEGRFHQAAYFYALNLFERLQNSAHPLQYHRCGALLLATDANEQQRQQKLLARREWPDDHLQYLSSEQASELSRIILPYGGLCLSKSGWINPASVCQVLIETNKHIECLYNIEIATLTRNNRRWQLFDTDDRQITDAEVVVIANAQAAHRFAQTEWLPLQLIRGQTTRIRASDLSQRLNTVLCGSVYLTPVHNGQHLLGATFQRDDVSKELRTSDDEKNLAQLAQMVPAFATQFKDIESQHAALRVATPDRLPVVGAVPDYAAFQQDYAELWKGKPDHHYPPARHLNGLYLMTGFGARGLSTIPLAAELLAAMIAQEKLPLAQTLVDALNPARWIIKTLRQAVR